MHLRRFANPWWLLCGAVAGGLAWAVTLPVWAAAVIGVIIWLTAVLVFGFLFPSPAPAPEPPASPAAADPDAECARRAHAAAASFAELAAPLADGPLGERVRQMVWRTAEIAASIDHLARRAHALAALAHAPTPDPYSRDRARYVEGRHAEVRRRMHAATGDLEAAVPRLLQAAPSPAAPDAAALERLAADLENIGYGVDIGEGIVDEILGPEPPPAPGAPPR
ncbi:hypothetical protein FOF52_12440 [Thermobifida alba]|uniref:Uncharacterized protein n=1 Tax=Thermobifida alba TaxID=53522 RepID=A0ABY4L2R0_THEAE|nr:hypothetical protein [Thermobifida alba]UPT21655.1 hypothetical protein FOF52_12440 [Thermobifida alba]HLU95623.1 hypothetical protein [Thermobifida alba]